MEKRCIYIYILLSKVYLYQKKCNKLTKEQFLSNLTSVSHFIAHTIYAEFKI